MRVQGSGTFVSTRKVYRFPLKGFDKLSHFASFNYTTKEKRVIMFDQASGDEKIVDALHLSQNENYMVSKYVVLIDNAEVLLQTIYLPEKYFPKLSIYDIERHNIKELVTKRYSYTMKKVKNGFSPVNLSSSEALLLNTYKHAAAHRVRTTMLTDDDKPLLYIETLFLGQFTQFEVIMG
ncbi:MAG: GntR family transcriptional regulator [Acholeplasmataceae bacterium]|nr:GntR family transcriptional regulator [Acholeplasmataceae bacterium]